MELITRRIIKEMEGDGKNVNLDVYANPDSSEYKDYILTLLFMKYVTDKYKNKGAYEDIKVFDKEHDPEPDQEKRTGCSFDDFIALKGKRYDGSKFINDNLKRG